MAKKLIKLSAEQVKELKSLCAAAKNANQKVISPLFVVASVCYNARQKGKVPRNPGVGGRRDAD